MCPDDGNELGRAAAPSSRQLARRTNFLALSLSIHPSHSEPAQAGRWANQCREKKQQRKKRDADPRRATAASPGPSVCAGLGRRQRGVRGEPRGVSAWLTNSCSTRGQGRQGRPASVPPPSRLRPASTLPPSRLLPRPSPAGADGRRVRWVRAGAPAKRSPGLVRIRTVRYPPGLRHIPRGGGVSRMRPRVPIQVGKENRGPLDFFCRQLPTFPPFSLWPGALRKKGGREEEEEECKPVRRRFIAHSAPPPPPPPPPWRGEEMRMCSPRAPMDAQLVGARGRTFSASNSAVPRRTRSHRLATETRLRCKSPCGK